MNTLKWLSSANKPDQSESRSTRTCLKPTPLWLSSLPRFQPADTLFDFEFF